MPEAPLRLTEPALYPRLEPYCRGNLVVDDIHTLYWEECGNPQGEPVLFFHGGPGAGMSHKHRQFFDPAHYRIVLFDQRGAGKSKPLGEVRNNTTQLLVQDTERIREMLGIEKWLVFGGSWGSTMALAYGQAHPERCTGFVLRGIFLCTQAEIDWFINGIQWFFPDAHERFVEPIAAPDRNDLMAAYRKQLFSDNPAENLAAARTWGRYEGSCIHLLPNPEVEEEFGNATIGLAVGRLEAHYFSNQGFFSDDQLIRNVDRMRHLPAVIIHGRYDMLCPPLSAWRLHKAWPEARFELIPDAGHGAFEPSITSALVRATDHFKQARAF